VERVEQLLIHTFRVAHRRQLLINFLEMCANAAGWSLHISRELFDTPSKLFSRVCNVRLKFQTAAPIPFDPGPSKKIIRNDRHRRRDATTRRLAEAIRKFF